MAILKQMRGSWFAVSVAAVVCACARTPAPASTPTRDARMQRDTAASPALSEIKSGLFNVRRSGEKLYFEIPASEFGKEILLSRVGIQKGGWLNAPPKVVVFERAGNRLLLRQKQYGIRGKSGSPDKAANDSIDIDLILAALDIEATGPDNSVVVDVARLLTSDLFSSTMLAVNPQRTFIERFATFPDNVNVELTITATIGSMPEFTGRLNWSFYKLPEPMRPRLFDARIGLNGVCFVDLSRPEHESRRGFVRRFRLEKKNPQAAVSDPIKPIIFWIDRSMPESLLPWVKRGVEVWQPAFREAGFSNAIITKRAPAPEEDPNWSIGDVRYSVIKWGPDTLGVAGSGGINAVDPRSGEIIRSDVAVFPNMKLFSQWYFVQVSPLDTRVRSWPLPDSLLGSLVEYVVTHEVGHAIGLTHNQKASSQYHVDSLRSVPFLRRMGVTPSIMDYARFNYVAQPEDNIPPELLIPRIGPYDRFAIMWAYQEIPGARTPEDERATIEDWARLQETIPYLRYEVDDATADPDELTEAVGDADPVRSSKLGMKNLQRAMSTLLTVAEKPGRDYTVLRELYGRAIEQWTYYNQHVAALIGGVHSRNRYGTGPRFSTVPASRQREAVPYLTEYALRVPAMFLDTAILRRIEQDGVVDRIRGVHGALLNSLLSGERLNRMLEQEALSSPRADQYKTTEYLADLRHGVWSELTESTPNIDIYRRNLQHAYLAAAGNTFEPPAEPASFEGSLENTTGCAEHRSLVGKRADGPAKYAGDARALLRGELLEIQQSIRSALSRTKDVMTRRHLRDLDAEIGRIFDR